MARPVVDLPQPDSPTRPSVSPRLISKETPSTAFTSATFRWKIRPAVTGKYIFRSSTRTSVSPIRALVSAPDARDPLCVVMTGTASLSPHPHPLGAYDDASPTVSLTAAAGISAVPFTTGSASRPTRSYSQQAEKCFSATIIKGGTSSRHLSTCQRQRG